MDTSKEYIKMCEKSPKLQPHDSEFHNGDYICYKSYWGIYFDEYFYQECVYNDGNHINYDYNPFRLHTQDQLQEMWDYSHSTMRSLQKFACELDNNYDYYDKFTSMEQFWLAFVMKEKYGKTWDKNNWTKE